VSTYVYLICLDHTPPLVSEEESGQHLSDLPQIRADIADRERIVANVADDIWPADYFRVRTARFLAQHPRCRVGIRDEYGVDHPATSPPSPGPAGRKLGADQPQERS